MFKNYVVVNPLLLLYILWILSNILNDSHDLVVSGDKVPITQFTSVDQIPRLFKLAAVVYHAYCGKKFHILNTLLTSLVAFSSVTNFKSLHAVNSIFALQMLQNRIFFRHRPILVL